MVRSMHHLSSNRIAVLVIVLATMIGCAADPSSPEKTVLLISLDALRADHVSSYGHSRPTTPFLDSLSTEGSRFTRAFVNTHGTPPSHATMLSSLYQETHRVGFRTAGPGTRNDHVPEVLTMVQQILQDNEWHTCAVTGGGYMSGSFGFSRGFDQFSDRGTTIETGVDLLVRQLRGAPVGKRPIFAMFHTYEVHSPYLPPDDLRNRFLESEPSIEPVNESLVPLQDNASKTLTDRDFRALAALYDAEILHTDRMLKRLFAFLDELGFLENSLVIITADHGEEFGDHGGLLHRVSLFEELLRVPLIVVGGDFQAGRVRPDLVSLIDIAPTILAYAEVEQPPWMEGMDLRVERGTDRWSEQRVFSQYADLLYSVRTPRWKLILRRRGRQPLLFDLLRDPTERRSVARERPELVEHLTGDLEDWLSALPVLERDGESPQSLSPETLQELRALGYVE